MTSDTATPPHWSDRAVAHVNVQGRGYRRRRLENPADFGHADGCFDGTPERYGPMPLICVEREEVGARWWVLWGMHKHRFPSDYWFCFGNAWDSKGERTDPLLLVDIRTLPKQYIGRFQLHKLGGCGMGKQRAIFTRALADGYDLAAHAARQHQLAIEAAAARRQQLAERIAANACQYCGALEGITDGECELCAEIPF